jgi:hypothetical protein
MRPTDAAACVIEPSLNRARDHSPLQHPQAQALQRSQPIDIDEFTHTKAGRALYMIPTSWRKGLQARCPGRGAVRRLCRA